jgi:hypothetical protein
MPDRSRKRPTDASQLGKLIVDLATGDVEDAALDDGKNPQRSRWAAKVASRAARPVRPR